MKYFTQSHADQAARLASSFSRVLLDGRRLTIASVRSGNRSESVRFWLHLHNPLPGQPDRWEATGLYLERGGIWMAPRGSKSVRFFSTPEAAQKAALAWAYKLNRYPVPTE